IALMMLTAVVNVPALAMTPPAEPPEPPVQTARGPVLPPHEHTESCELTSAEPVQIVCILDRSGSMRALAGDTIGGYNSFLDKQRKEPGEAEVTTVLFDDKYELIGAGVPLAEAPELTPATYYARGTTALLDAVGRTIMETAGRMEKEGVCPAKRRVLFLIMTDGLENASREYDKASVKAMIEAATQEYHWNFVFMGANIDSVAEASSMGISAQHAVNYTHDRKGVAAAFECMEAAAREVREEGRVGEAQK
ncbi:MAG: VWA domain-containing protein, partial [Oscillospiraceae bacterium]|nr:VWA domain-containing protein [Oscillospiraceae bacterium]